MNIGKLRNLENSNFLFGWRGPLVMIFDRVGSEGRKRVAGGRGSRWGTVRGQIRWVGAVRGLTGAARARWGQDTWVKMVGVEVLGIGVLG